MSVAALSLKRPVTAIMFFVSLLVIGLIAAIRLPLEFFPTVDAPFAFISLPYPGSTPSESERTLTRPVEETLSTLSGVKRMSSQSTAEGSQIFLEFDWDQEIAIKTSEVRERIDAIRDELPSDLQRYFVQKFSTGDEAILKVRLASDYSLANAYDLLERKLKRPIERLPGVARVDISGVSPGEVEIELNVDRITAHGLSLNEIGVRLQQANFSVSAGQVLEANRRFRVQPLGEFRNLDDIRNLPMNTNGLRLSDIANIELKPARLDFRRHLDMKQAVGIDIFKERNANLVNTGKLALDEVNKIAKDPELKGIQLYVLSDQAEGVVKSLFSLAEAGIIGSLLSLVMLYFFLRHWPSTLMVSMAVPICFVMTLGLMYFFGITLNVLSMMGLLLGVGMVVDNAVVAVESIYQQREKYPLEPVKASISGVRNVTIALSAGTLCHCIVFLPNIFGEKNFISIYLSQVAITITISLLASWLVAVSLIPMLSARIATPSGVNQEGIVARMKGTYARVLEWTLLNRRKTMLATLSLLLASCVPMTQVKIDMFPAGQTREVNLGYELNGIYTLEEMERSISQIERFLLDNKKRFEIRSVYSWMSETQGASTGIMFVDDGTEKRGTEELMEEIRKELPKIAIGEANFGFQRRGGSGEGLQVSLIGDSSEQLRELANTVVNVLRSMQGLRDVRVNDASTNREIAVRVDRERAALYGFSAQDVAAYVSVALRGSALREFRSSNGEVPVWLRFAGDDVKSVANLKEFKLRQNNGGLIPLMSLVDVKMQEQASAIQRVDRQTSIPVSINLAPGLAMNVAQKQIEARLSALAFPPGYRWSFGGGFDESDEAGSQMLFNTLIALLMIYIVMAAVFESLLFPLTILTTIVFSICGVFWFFWATQTDFSIMASIGILILMGVVVNNGIVMIEHINQLRHSGMPRDQALVAGSRDRLRPILMTMGTTILGMIPLCIGSTQIGGDGPPYFPMARAIVGGLLFSTVITLLVLPVIYALLDDGRQVFIQMLSRARKGLSFRADSVHSQ
jgi:HAE1 family hydrophobic/amphiphilic exporter-1